VEGPGARHELNIVEDLAEGWPHLAPDIIAVDMDRAWLLMPDHGIRMADTHDAAGQTAVIERIIGPYATMQRETRGLLPRWIRGGTPDRPVQRLPSLILDLLTSNRASRLPLEDAERAAIRSTLSEVISMCDELAATPFSNGIDHADMHGGNVLVKGEDARVTDWGDACVTHPFSSLFVPYQHAVARMPASERRAAALRLRDAYLEPWTDVASRDELRRTFAAATWLGHLIRALNFDHHIDLEADAVSAKQVATFLRRWIEQKALPDRPDDLVEAIANQREG
jgi:hypothetical protein